MSYGHENGGWMNEDQRSAVRAEALAKEAAERKGLMLAKLREARDQFHLHEEEYNRAEHALDAARKRRSDSYVQMDALAKYLEIALGMTRTELFLD